MVPVTSVSKSWKIVTFVSLSFLALSVGGLAVLGVYYYDETTQPSLSQQINSECVNCYECLGYYTGQNVSSLCISRNNELSIALQCSSQVYYLFTGTRAASSSVTSCTTQCSTCTKTTVTLADTDTTLSETRWETIFDDYFVPASSWDPIRTVTTQEGTLVRQPASVPGFEADGDACCGTSRQTLPLMSSIVYEGFTYYPVWLYKSWATLQYSFQYYDDVTCTLNTASCSADINCHIHSEIRTYLYTTDMPNNSTGHTFILLTYPNTNVRFISREMEVYCKCVL